jgi:hypothetical protein
VYVNLVLFILATIFWLGRLNNALDKYDPLFIVPLFQAGYIVLSTTAGGIYFQEFQNLSAVQVIIFICGIAVMLGGLALLMASRPKVSYQEKDQKQQQSLHIVAQQEDAGTDVVEADTAEVKMAHRAITTVSVPSPAASASVFSSSSAATVLTRGFSGVASIYPPRFQTCVSSEEQKSHDKADDAECSNAAPEDLQSRVSNKGKTSSRQSAFLRWRTLLLGESPDPNMNINSWGMTWQRRDDHGESTSSSTRAPTTSASTVVTA